MARLLTAILEMYSIESRLHFFDPVFATREGHRLIWLPL